MALQKYSGIPENKVIGMAGVLDTSRFKYFISGIKRTISEIDAFVLGHGDTMVPFPNKTFVSGKPLSEYIENGKISHQLEEIINRTRSGGAEVVKLLETGSAFYAPAALGLKWQVF